MARYKLYCVGASGNSYKVALYLSCAGVRPGTTPPTPHGQPIALRAEHFR